MKRRAKKSIIIAFVIILVLVLGFFGTLYYITSTVNNYSYAEKTWINENEKNAIDIYIESSLPIFAYNGVGVYYDYINALKEDTNLNLNVVASDNTSSVRLENKNSLVSDDILFYKDHFVVVGAKSDITKISDLDYKTIGVFANDKDTVEYYLTDYNNVVIKEFADFKTLVSSYEDGSINYIVIPLYKYIDNIISSNLDIIYHMDGLYSYYCLSFDADVNENLKSVFTKFYYRYKDKIESKINSYFLDIYYDARKYSELEKESITNEDFIVGYINNLPFEGMIGTKFAGLTNTYLSKFSNIAGVTYKYVEYKDIKELSSSLSEKKIDIMLNYYSLSNDDYIGTRTFGSTEYVVLASNDNNIVINSLYTLKHSTVDMLSNTNLKYSMANKELFEINDYSSIKSLLKNINDDSIIIIEKEVYDYYKDSSLKNFSIRFIDSIRLNNSFLLKKDNEAFNDLFDFYLSTLSSNEVKNESIGGIIGTLKSNRIFNFIISNLIYIVVIGLVVLFIVIAILKKIAAIKKSNKENRLYYFDAMTNLKNRNFLNDNIEFWNSAKVFPQAIIVIDINKLKVLNDKDGHEAGDNQIKSVAGVLIKTQRDNSEIMRTDGDEFMIYLVGYDEKKIGTYIHKLNKELSAALPNKDYGVSIGYSMILNEQMTIDDAINDSLEMIHKSKVK